MSRKQTKAQQILDEARMRVRIADDAVREVQRKLDASYAELKAHRAAFEALERSLAPKPRKKKAEPEQKTLLEAGATKIPHGGRNRKDGTDGKSSSEEGRGAAASNDG